VAEIKILSLSSSVSTALSPTVKINRSSERKLASGTRISTVSHHRPSTPSTPTQTSTHGFNKLVRIYKRDIFIHNLVWRCETYEGLYALKSDGTNVAVFQIVLYNILPLVEKAHWEFNGRLIFESMYISRVSENYRHLLDTDDYNKKQWNMY
jgi:hypothetical protein